jgi:hypothetical protein
MSDIERLRNGVAEYADGISAGNEAKQSHEQSDDQRADADMIRLA